MNAAEPNVPPDPIFNVLESVPDNVILLLTVNDLFDTNVKVLVPDALILNPL